MTDLRHGFQISRHNWHHRPESEEAGKAIELAAFNGTITFAGGEKAAFAGVETVDFGQRDEPFSGTLVALLDDGSASHQSFSGRTTRAEAGGRMAGTGVWQFLWGTGRFAGLTGGGPLSWTIEDGIWRAEFRPDPSA